MTYADGDSPRQRTRFAAVLDKPESIDSTVLVLLPGQCRRQCGALGQEPSLCQDRAGGLPERSRSISGYDYLLVVPEAVDVIHGTLGAEN